MCKQPANLVILENKSIEDKVKKHVQKFNKRIGAVEYNLNKNTETTELEKLQNRLENEEKERQNR